VDGRRPTSASVARVPEPAGAAVNDTWSKLAAGFMPGAAGVAGVAASLLVLALAPKGDGMWRTLLVVGAIVIGAAVTALLHLLLMSLMLSR
jgi:hypothetical protein